MRTWVNILGGLIVWAIHFFAVYGASSVFLTSTTSRIMTALVTFACLTAAAALATRGWAGQRDNSDPSQRFAHTVGGIASAIACIAIIWQGLPALLI